MLRLGRARCNVLLPFTGAGGLQHCPYKYLYHDSHHLLKTSTSTCGNRKSGRFLSVMPGAEDSSPSLQLLLCPASSLWVVAQQALISADTCTGTRALPHPSADVLHSAGLWWEELRVTALCLLKRSGQLVLRVHWCRRLRLCFRASFGAGVPWESWAQPPPSHGQHPGMQLTQEEEASGRKKGH